GGGGKRSARASWACPEGACPEGACPEGACPEGACPEGACPEGACPEGACPEGPLRGLALPAVIAGHAAKAHDQREQGLSGWSVGVVHQERPADAAGGLLDPGAMLGEPLLVGGTQRLYAVGDPALAALGRA